MSKSDQLQPNKIIVILGPTSSGKSDVAIRLAKKFNGEIISADSRQIYRGMDIGTGKVTKAEQALAKHHMLDIISPKTDYSVAKFKKCANKIIADILKRNKLPIICGGTGFWIKSLVDNVVYPEVKPDFKLREKLQKKSTEELFLQLEKLDPVRAKNIDAKNPVRLIRAIEICQTLGKVPKTRCESTNAFESTNSSNKKYQFLQLGITLPKEKLHKNIEKRLKQRFEAGMIEEVEKLHSENKISWKRLESFGLGYKVISQYLREKVHPVEYFSFTKNNFAKQSLFNRIYLAEKDYAKRQMTWFQKDKRILWLPASSAGRKKYSEIEKEVRRFIEK